MSETDVLFTAVNPEKRGGFEYASYALPIKNYRYPDIIDGIYAELISYQDKYLIASVDFYVPNGARNQIIESKRFDYPWKDGAASIPENALRWIEEQVNICKTLLDEQFPNWRSRITAL